MKIGIWVFVLEQVASLKRELEEGVLNEHFVNFFPKTSLFFDEKYFNYCGSSTLLWVDHPCKLFVFEGLLQVCGSLSSTGRVWVLPKLNGTHLLGLETPPAVSTQSQCYVTSKHRPYSELQLGASDLLVSGPLVVGGNLVVADLILDMAAVAIIGLNGPLPSLPRFSLHKEQRRYREALLDHLTNPSCPNTPEPPPENPPGQLLPYSAAILRKIIVDNGSHLYVFGDVFGAEIIVDDASFLMSPCGTLRCKYNTTFSLLATQSSFVHFGAPYASSAVLGIGLQSGALAGFSGGLIVKGNLEIDDTAEMLVASSFVADRIAVTKSSHLAVQGDFLATTFLEVFTSSTFEAGNRAIAETLQLKDGAHATFRKNLKVNKSTYVVRKSNLTIEGDFQTRQSLFLADESALYISGRLAVDKNLRIFKSQFHCNESARILGSSIILGSEMHIKKNLLLQDPDMNHNRLALSTNIKNSTLSHEASQKEALQTQPPCLVLQFSKLNVQKLICKDSWVSVSQNSFLHLHDSLLIGAGYFLLKAESEVLIDKGLVQVGSVLVLNQRSSLKVLNGSLFTEALVVTGKSKLEVSEDVFAENSTVLLNQSKVAVQRDLVVGDRLLNLAGRSTLLVGRELLSGTDVFVEDFATLQANHAIVSSGSLVTQDGGRATAPTIKTMKEVVSENEGVISADVVHARLGVRSTDCEILIQIKQGRECENYNLELSRNVSSFITAAQRESGDISINTTQKHEDTTHIKNPKKKPKHNPLPNSQAHWQQYEEILGAINLP